MSFWSTSTKGKTPFNFCTKCTWWFHTTIHTSLLEVRQSPWGCCSSGALWTRGGTATVPSGAWGARLGRQSGLTRGDKPGNTVKPRKLRSPIFFHTRTSTFVTNSLLFTFSPPILSISTLRPFSGSRTVQYWYSSRRSRTKFFFFLLFFFPQHYYS